LDRPNEWSLYWLWTGNKHQLDFPTQLNHRNMLVCCKDAVDHVCWRPTSLHSRQGTGLQVESSHNVSPGLEADR